MHPAKPQAAPPAALSTSVFQLDIFNGKVLFCTGGGSGICKRMTEAIMKHGAAATIVGRKIDRLTNAAKELENATGQPCLAAQADVRNPADLKDAVAKTISRYGRIDFVICGAAGNFLAPIDGLSENGFRTVIEIDTLGTYHTIKATLPYIRETQGAYIHVSATLHQRGTPYQAHVSAAKAAVDALSNVLAVEEGPRGIRSNVIAPGPISDTEGMERLASKKDTRNQEAIASVPLQRMGETQDIANAAVFLFSEAAHWITGQILTVDGGHEHLRTTQLPYPSSVLDPEGTKAFIKARM